MSNLQRLEKIVKLLENYQTQLQADGHDQWADKVALAIHEMQWLYYDMSFYTDSG